MWARFADCMFMRWQAQSRTYGIARETSPAALRVTAVPGTSAEPAGPGGVAVDHAGNILVSDIRNARVIANSTGRSAAGG
jgi:hypothetical protein